MHRTRPRFPVERDACVRASELLLEAPDLHPALASSLKVEFLPASAAYLDAFGTYGATRAAQDWAIRQAHAAAAVFVRAYRRWVCTVTDEHGRRTPHELAQFFHGTLPGQIPELPHLEAVSLTAWLERQTAEHPRLAGDAARLAELVAAREVLREKATARESAVQTQVEARRAMVAQQKLFDGAWGNVVRIIRRVAPEHENKIPVFVDRKKRKAPGPEDVPEPAGAEAPKQEAQAEPKAEGASEAKTANTASAPPPTDPTDAPDPGMRSSAETASGSQAPGADPRDVPPSG